MIKKYEVPYKTDKVNGKMIVDADSPKEAINIVMKHNKRKIGLVIGKPKLHKED